MQNSLNDNHTKCVSGVTPSSWLAGHQSPGGLLMIKEKEHCPERLTPEDYFPPAAPEPVSSEALFSPIYNT